jgi:hypothetical protein
MSKLYVDEILPSSANTVTFTQGGSSTLISPSYVGELKSFRIRRTTSTAFPFWNLSLPDQTLSAGTYPDYVNYLRDIKIETCNPTQFSQTITMSGSPTTTATFSSALSSTLTVGNLLYFHSSGQFRTIVGVTSNTVYTLDEAISGSALVVSSIDQSTYSSTFAGSWSGTTFTLTNNAQNKILIDALSEDAYYQGASISSNVITPINNTNWLVLRWGSTDINITSFNISTTPSITIASGSPTGTTIELYPHRIAGSIDARHKQVDDSVLINNGIQVVNGLRLRDRLQGHYHNQIGAFGSTGSGGNYLQASTESNLSSWSYNRGAISDTVNGNTRTGQFTRPRGLGVYFYEYMGRINV